MASQGQGGRERELAGGVQGDQSGGKSQDSKHYWRRNTFGLTCYFLLRLAGLAGEKELTPLARSTSRGPYPVSVIHPRLRRRLDEEQLEAQEG